MKNSTAQKRNTVQKRIIRQVVEKSGRPLTPGEILSFAKKSVPTLGMATIYRELRRLKDEGEITQIDLPGDSPRFGLKPQEPTHHFKCSRCNHVFLLDNQHVDVQIKLPSEYKHQSHQVVIYGVCGEDCKECQK